ncbi:MAG: alkaline phosphatase family protein [Verrucomicrobiota bacterium]
MPKIRHGPLKGFHLPDYDGGSIVNLMSSVIRSRGGRSPHPELRVLPARELAGARNVIYVVVDGVGREQVDRHVADGRGKAFFAVHPSRTITTVCPATTAAAVTTFGTGATPAEHGILGWFLHLHDLGLVSTILLTTTRTDSSMAAPSFDLGKYLRVPEHLASVNCRRALISWGHIPESRFSRAGTPWDEARSFSTLTGLEREVAACARKPGRSVAYVYWPEYDTFCHGHGCRHRKTVQHLEQIDRVLARLVKLLEGTDTVLLVTADHGLVDLPRGAGVELRDVPGFYDCLAMIPSGDARQVQCFVRPAKVGTFKNLVRRHLGKACVCVPGEYLIGTGAFGPGRQHPSLANRVGDFVLVARGGHAFASNLPGARSAFNAANHGGMSATEMFVPLYVVRC